MEKNAERIFLLTLNGKQFVIDPSGQMAIDTDGKAVRLADQDRNRWGR